MPVNAGRIVCFCVGAFICVSALAWWAVGQEQPTSSPKQPEPKPQKTIASAKGFADVLRERRRHNAVADSESVSPALSTRPEREQWLRLLASLHLRPPARPEGWKFSAYSWRRWRGALASRAGSLRRWRIVTMEATAYCPKGCCGSRHGRTATGRRAEYGVAAVDPRRIPLGTALYVDRYGFAIAADTGSAIKGNRIDLCFPTHREANRFGRRQVRVLILR